MNIHKAKELAAARAARFNCSAIENPVQWNVFYEDGTAKAIKVAKISDELSMLESMCIFHLKIYYLFFIDNNPNVDKEFFHFSKSLLERNSNLEKL